ncbi:hypothetical protein NDU88_001249 [Pleurodeles waltl]|uniref:Uncharacterized protein n=1 Tax=Pleurodeles waltl TaxID=8319 RepID=A0AAV7U6C5_PLEWA|nr:hypothetical protein NDU88_001249 [Pleurodeles waltl]
MRSLGAASISHLGNSPGARGPCTCGGHQLLRIPGARLPGASWDPERGQGAGSACWEVSPRDARISSDTQDPPPRLRTTRRASCS